jgi:D-alanyl-D-alanine carboxypeptidase
LTLQVILAALAKGAEPELEKAAYRGKPLHAAVPDDFFANVPDLVEAELDSELVAKLDDAVTWIFEKTSVPGLTAAIAVPGQGVWATSQGVARTDPRTPLADRPYFHWASVGKLFTGVVVQQLIEEGKLRDEDPLSRWFPDFPDADDVTIDHLLTHTSGIFSFNTDLVFRKERGYHSPEKLIQIAARHGLVCRPGEQWYYSNTGYVFLARIIEEVEGKPFHEVVQARILGPLQMTDTVALAPDQRLEGLAVGHVDGKPDEEFEPTTPFGAGIVVGSAKDMVRFLNAYLSGRLVSRENVLEAYSRLFPMFDQPGPFYGRGVMLLEFEDGGQSNVWLGHCGGTPGIKAVVAYDPRTRVFVAVALNGNVSAEACANKLLKVVESHRAAGS